MAFIEYIPTRGGLGPNSAKLTKTHLILSPDIQDRLDGNNVAVAFDPELKVIRLKPVEAGGLKITDGKLQSKGFVRHFGIDTKGLFDAKWDDNEKAVFIDIEHSR